MVKFHMNANMHAHTGVSALGWGIKWSFVVGFSVPQGTEYFSQNITGDTKTPF